MIPFKQYINEMAQDVSTNEKFKQWFGDSKVVDSNNKPLVVYHGTTSDFSEFMKKDPVVGKYRFEGREGFFFTSNPREAGDSSTQTAIYGGKKSQSIIPVYLRIENPYIRNTSKEFAQLFYDRNWKQIQDMSMKKGHDGIIVNGKNSSTYIVFKSNQIKSAIGNIGDYSSDGDITK